MSFESNEDRIEHLETTAKAMLIFNKALLDWADKSRKDQQQQFQKLIAFTLGQSKQLFAIGKTIASLPNTLSTEDKKRLLEQAEHDESELDKLIASFNDEVSKQPPTPLLPPWPPNENPPPAA